MPPIFVKALVFLLLSSFWCQAFGQELLDQLSSQLTTARSSPQVEPIGCPRVMDALVGVSSDAVLSKLGKPDMSEIGRDSTGEYVVAQYIFANSRANWLGIGVSAGGYSAITPLGDMFSVVQFHYGAQNKVIRAFCYDR